MTISGDILKREGVEASTASPAASVIMSDRYITPDYVAPLPASEKTGKSPLQLLAQACSQIGADPGSHKFSEKNNNEDNNIKRSPNLIVTDAKPVSFKPYESKDQEDHQEKDSISPPVILNGSSRSSPASNSSSSKVTKTSGNSTPVIRSGMEVLAGHPKDIPLGTYNPAFRPTFPFPGFGSQHLGVCRDPYCRDPACLTAVYNSQIAACLPPGYAELLEAHHKFSSGLIPGFPNPATTTVSTGTTTSSSSSSSPSSATQHHPYICNWINGSNGYCGKRHASAEELLQHLRTHTNLSTTDSAAAAAAAATSAIYPPSHPFAAAAAAAALHSRNYNLNSRFHPYAKPTGAHLIPGLGGALGGGTTLTPPPGLHPSLLSYATPSSLYAVYGSRLTGSSVLP